MILGERDASRAGGSTAGLTARVFRRETQVVQTSDPEAATGKLVDIVRHVADVLAAFGEKLSAGDVIIAGSVVPPLLVEADETSVAYALEPVGKISVTLAR